jgi:hypothetical protein
MTDFNTDPKNNAPTPEDLDDKTVDPRDLVRKGGYRKNPREIVENPAVTPQMLDEPQQSRAGNIRKDRDEDEP